MIPKITLTDAPTPEMRKAIVEPLVEFNHSRIGKPETYRPRWPFCFPSRGAMRSSAGSMA